MTKQRECPSCATMVPSDHEQCFICGYEFAGGRNRWSWRVWAAIVLLAIFLIPFIRLLLRALE
jgi:uncharacterized paraquat-inducible protein A